MIDVIPYDEVAGEVVSDGAECVGVLADHVLAEQGVDAADYPDGADEDLVQHGELVLYSCNHHSPHPLSYCT